MVKAFTVDVRENRQRHLEELRAERERSRLNMACRPAEGQERVVEIERR